MLIVRPPYRFQFSFNFLLVLIVLGFLVLHYFLRFVHFLRFLPANRRNKQEAQRLKASNDWLLEGMHALAEGDFINAETAIQKAHDLVQNADHEKLMAGLLKKRINKAFYLSNCIIFTGIKMANKAIFVALGGGYDKFTLALVKLFHQKQVK